MSSTTATPTGRNATSGLVSLDALGPSGPYRTREPEIVNDVAGTAVAELSVAPTIFATHAISAQRKAAPLPAAERVAAMQRAGELFLHDDIGGLSFDEYVRLASRTYGMPISSARAQALSLAGAFAASSEANASARPLGIASDWREERASRGGGAWARRGEMFAVLASGNALSVHALWLQALPLGYRVAVRPSRREPFTPHRIIWALREAGFGNAGAAYLSTDYTGADKIVASADLSMVYGGQDVVDRYAADSAVFAIGPGRSKILITAEHDWRDYIDIIVESVVEHSGMACVCATAVLYEGDPEPLARAVAERLAQIKPLPVDDPAAALPVQPLKTAHAVAEFLQKRAKSAAVLLGADQVVAELGDGSAALRPAVHLLDRPHTEQLGTELALPCVWVAPWSRSDGLPPLRNSLVLNAITSDEDLLDQLLAEPTIANLYSGAHPTTAPRPEIPHDGYVADFLMRNKGFIRG